MGIQDDDVESVTQGLENYWVVESKAIYLSRQLYQQLSYLAAQNNGGYTGQGIISDLVEEIVQAYIKSKS